VQIRPSLVEQRAADAPHVFFDGDGVAFADVAVVSQVAAGTRVHGGDEHEVGGERRGCEGAGDGDDAAFEGLTEHFEAAAVELGEFVEKEDAVVGEGDFARGGRGAAADHAGVGNRMVRRAKRAGGEQRLIGGQAAQGAVDARRFQAFGEAQGGQNRGQALGEHGLAGAGGADEHDVMSPGRGDDEAAFRVFLAAHVLKIEIVGAEFREEFGELAGDRFDVEAARENTYGIGERVEAENIDAFDDGGFAGVGHGDEKPFDAELLGRHGAGQGPFDGPHAAIESELADDGAFLDLLGGESPHGDEHAQGDRQIETAGVFTQIGGSEFPFRKSCPGCSTPTKSTKRGGQSAKPRP
jgi:hypothetical protein